MENITAQVRRLGRGGLRDRPGRVQVLLQGRGRAHGLPRNLVIASSAEGRWMEKIVSGVTTAYSM